MNNAKIAKSVLAIITTIAIGASGAVMAGEADEIKGKAVKVTFGHLNLEKERGAQELYRRLRHASKTACGVEISKKTKSARAMSDAYRCYRKELAATVKKLDNELVTQIHEGS